MREVTVLLIHGRPHVRGQRLAVPSTVNPVQEIHHGSLARVRADLPGVEREGLIAPAPPRLERLYCHLELLRRHEGRVELDGIAPGHGHGPVPG